MQKAEAIQKTETRMTNQIRRPNDQCPNWDFGLRASFGFLVFALCIEGSGQPRRNPINRKAQRREEEFLTAEIAKNAEKKVNAKGPGFVFMKIGRFDR